jgi:hypothetical protein
LQAQSKHLKNQIAHLKQQSSEIAVIIKAVENDQHEESLHQYSFSDHDITISRQQKSI